MTDPDKATRAAVLAAFSKQIGWCASLGSRLTAEVLTLLAADIEAGGTGASVVDSWPGDPLADALPLRMAGALHALVLMGLEAELAACYAPQDAGAAGRLRSALPQALDRHRDFIEAFVTSPPQTNEVGRSGVLAGGFLEIAQSTGLPLRLFEIGASAGLNTIWDRYHYRFGDAEWGDPQSPVRLAPAWTGPLPPLGAPVQVAERRACDVAPIDLEDETQRLRLRAYVWADQRERLARLEAAIGLARTAGRPVERADAAQWVRARLDEPAAASVTVVYHSIMWQYMPAGTQSDIAASLERAGRVAGPSTPLAWLRFEPTLPERMELRLTLWPDGTDRCLAVAHPHGASVAWSGV